VNTQQENIKNTEHQVGKAHPGLTRLEAIGVLCILVGIATVVIMRNAEKFLPDTGPVRVMDNMDNPPKLCMDLNKASHEELCLLPGIGQVRADAILEYRRKNGDFSSVDELVKVSGISEKLIQGFQDCVTINSHQDTAKESGP